MNRFHCILLMVILFFAIIAFASDNSTTARVLTSGYFDIANVNSEGEYMVSAIDSIDGVYLYIESGWVDGCCTPPRYTEFTIGKNLSSGRNENIWVLTDYSSMDSLKSEMRKGKSLPLEKFTKLEFDSTHVQYLVYGFNLNRHEDIKTNRNILGDSVYITGYNGNYEVFAVSSLPDEIVHDYILFQREDSVTAFCGIVNNSICYYKIECLYQNSGLFVFDSLPNPSHFTGSSRCPDGVGSSLLPVNRAFDIRKRLDRKTYKVNGTSATKGSSSIIIENKQSKLQLKGNH